MRPRSDSHRSLTHTSALTLKFGRGPKCMSSSFEKAKKEGSSALPGTGEGSGLALERYGGSD